MKKVLFILLLLVSFTMTACSKEEQVDGSFTNIIQEKGMIQFKTTLDTKNVEITEIQVVLSDDDTHSELIFSSKSGLFAEGQTDLITIRYLKENTPHTITYKVFYKDNDGNNQEQVLDTHTFTTSTWEHNDPIGEFRNQELVDDDIFFDLLIESEDYRVYQFIILILDEEGNQLSHIAHQEDINFNMMYQDVSFTGLTQGETYTLQLVLYYCDFSQEDNSDYQIVDEYTFTYE